MNIATAITTAPRPRPTLRDSLASYRAAGFDNDVLVLSDGHCAPLDDKRAILLINDPIRGCLGNWVQALDLLLRLTTETFLLVLQDDVTWCANGRALLADAPERACSLFLPRRVARYLQKRRGEPVLAQGWLESDMGWSTWGAQAFMLHRPIAAQLMADAQFLRFRRDCYKNVDRIVPKCLLDLGIPIHYRNPGLVHHAAGSANSSLGNKPVQPSLETVCVEV